MASMAGGLAVGGIVVVIAVIATVATLLQAQQKATPGPSCRRECVEGDHRICQFNFDVHIYQTLSRACYDCPRNATHCDLPDCIPGDGVRRRLNVVNKQMPGPAIQVCQGDKIEVKVNNLLPASGLTVHWHGLTMAAGKYGSATPFMDGTPGVTQCPIDPGNSFTYTFTASEAGTHFWHAHTGFLRADGVVGSLIVHQVPGKDPNYEQYDFDLPEHIILFQDWTHVPTDDKFSFRHHGGEDDFPDSVLVNGRGPHQSLDATERSKLIPYQRFYVEQGSRYRFRLISSAVLNCPIVVSFDEHTITIIATDGDPIVPYNATSIVVHPGERWDVVIKANKPDGLYWITFMGIVDCVETSAHQMAVLQYMTKHSPQSSVELPSAPKPQYTNEKPTGIQVNSVNTHCRKKESICAANLTSTTSLPDNLKKPKADYTFYMAFQMRRIHNKHFFDKTNYNIMQYEEEDRIPTPQINNISLITPGTPVLLRSDPPSEVCNVNKFPPDDSCQETHCECLHLIEISLGASVDLVIMDEGHQGDEGHPAHLHGHHFYVLGQDRLRDVEGATTTYEEIYDMDTKGLLHRNLEYPISKDTVTIPDAGYTIIRFRADNPGYWFLHCHLLFHSVAGMGAILKVGDSTSIPAPPSGFPSCGDYPS